MNHQPLGAGAGAGTTRRASGDSGLAAVLGDARPGETTQPDATITPEIESDRPAEPAEPPTQLTFCLSCGIGNLLPPDSDPEKSDCVICEEPLVLELRKRQVAWLTDLFEPLTGIRMRFRERLGYRRIRSHFEIETDPNRYPQGDRLRVAMKEWHDGELVSWDLPKRPKAPLWDDRPWLLFGLVGAAAAIIVACVFAVATLPEEPQFAGHAPHRALLADPTSQYWKTTTEELDLARPAVLAFLAAESPAQLIDHVRDRHRVAPLIMKYYGPNRIDPTEPGELTLVDAIEFGPRTFLRIQAEIEGEKTIALTLEKGDGNYLVDWESFVGYSEVDWGEYKAEAPFAGMSVTLRANASFIEQYLPPFDDRSEIQSLLLESATGETLVGYIPRLADSCIDLRAKADEAGRNRYEVMVRVRYPDQAWTPNEVEIVEIIQTGWVEWDHLPDPPASDPRDPLQR